MTDSDDALLPLDAVRPPASSKDTKGAVVPAPERPVARVAVDNPLPHLDRPFDYLIPASMHETAQPGVRVRVRFAGKLADGFLLERIEESEHEGRLTPLERVVSPERVLTPEIAGLARAVADRYAGTLVDVLRLAIPPRHARAEGETPKPDARAASEVPEDAAPRPAAPTQGGSAWDAYPSGPSFLDALHKGRAPRAVWSALPGATGWAGAMAEAVRATLDGGRGAVVVVPDGKDVALADGEFARVLGPGSHVALTADLGPAERYRRWLKVLRGEVRAVVGTRAAMFAPVAELGLVVIWDDGDDLHAERLAPYPHAREVLGLRAHRTGAAMLIGGYARTAEATQLIASRWARPIVAARTTIRSLAPRVRPAGEDAELAKDQAARLARLPSLAWRALRQGLESGPVLVQVPRRGYLPALACRHCRAPARCTLPPTRMAPGLLAAAVPLGGSAGAGSPTSLPLVGPPGGLTLDVPLALQVNPAPAGGRGGQEPSRLPPAQAPQGGPGARPPAGPGGPESRGRLGGSGTPGRPDEPAAPRGLDGPASQGGPDAPAAPGGPGGSAFREGAGGPAAAGGPVSREGAGGPMHLGGAGGAASLGEAGAPESLGGSGAARPLGGGSASIGPLGEGVAFMGSLGESLASMGGHAEPAAFCHGPLALRGGHAAPYCRWCGRVDADWRCPSCGSPRLRAVVVGARRTAEELGRAFPSVQVRTSGRDGVLASVPATRALVVATPGAEPVAEGGYAAAVLLDGWALLGRADLRAGEEAVRRWMNAAALLRPAAELVVLADAALPAVQALLRWDPVTHAERELADRVELGFPPAVRMATLTGAASAVRQMLDEVRLPADAQVLGPVPVDDAGQERAMIRVRRNGGAALAAALKGASGVRAARKTPDVVRVSVDPLDLI
ncbi:primosomal protein N' family DNA-binding protein [Nonomuraea turcica]|uniref:primosomal protein N' family DNA-binding protein n=1 Tax=Nonomuraea sp. G32 TaxID=3067274 RepID=UPI00352FFEBB